MKYYLYLVFVLLAISAKAQYAPEAGMPGSTAIHQDSNIFVGWAIQADINRGWINMADTLLGKANVGNAQSALNKADNDVVSLGDGGTAVLTFEHLIYNGAGWDFAVFENSFDGHFLELAFVEVSSDGLHFYRFPAHSLTQNSVQITAFGTLNPTKINNLAGKYKVGYGTPFDLDELDSISGLDINNIQKIKIIDVVGSIDSNYATYDTAGNIINDPWPMSFASSGFDLDAVGVIHQTLGIAEKNEGLALKVFPNPTSDKIHFQTNFHGILSSVRITDFTGNLIFISTKPDFNTIDVSSWSAGIYILSIESSQGEILRRKFVILD